MEILTTDSKSDMYSEQSKEENKIPQRQRLQMQQTKEHKEDEEEKWKKRKYKNKKKKMNQKQEKVEEGYWPGNLLKEETIIFMSLLGLPEDWKKMMHEAQTDSSPPAIPILCFIDICQLLVEHTNLHYQ
jgi:hypothetical protein